MLNESDYLRCKITAKRDIKNASLGTFAVHGIDPVGIGGRTPSRDARSDR